MTAYGAGKKSTFDYTYAGFQHIHAPAKVYPTLANGVTVTGAAGAWTLGDYAEIIPASTITVPFDIHWINVEDASANDVYELVIYEGTTERGRIRFVADTSVFGGALPSLPIQVPQLSANSQIQAKLASAGGGSDTATISVYYHEYTNP